jgi:D-tyrosyl-tRNA(Tyr) deacylase
VRAVIQRVTEASVVVDGQVISAIGQGLLVLLAVQKGDTDDEAAWLAQRLPQLRIFADATGRMNLSLDEVKGEILLVSQFTLAANLARGRRPSFESAAHPESARALYDLVISRLSAGNTPVRTGLFGAMMQMMDMMGMVAMLVGSESLFVGWAAHLAISAALGVGFALIMVKGLDSWATGIGAGMAYGAAWWVLGALLLMPAKLGMPVFVFNTMAWQSLMGHLLFGMILGAVSVAIVRGNLRD